jgi:transcriptional regulator with XRE-family HTH domain
MKEKTWLEKMLDSVKDSFEFRLEKIILDLTEQICKRMQDREITRTQLARDLNVSPAAVTKILNGNSNFTLRTLLSLGDALNLDLGIEFRPKEISAQGSLGVWTQAGNVQEEGWIWTGNVQEALTWTSNLQCVTVTTASTPVSSTTLASAESSGKLFSFPERKQEQRAA